MVDSMWSWPNGMPELLAREPARRVTVRISRPEHPSKQTNIHTYIHTNSLAILFVVTNNKLNNKIHMHTCTTTTSHTHTHTTILCMHTCPTYTHPYTLSHSHTLYIFIYIVDLYVCVWRRTVQWVCGQFGKVQRAALSRYLAHQILPYFKKRKRERRKKSIIWTPQPTHTHTHTEREREMVYWTIWKEYCSKIIYPFVWQRYPSRYIWWQR